MALEHPNITLGTAGHIDHGKTELIKFLTGCDTDRLKAEKERGMSIDLGFAPCSLGNLQVGIVDVPGHENFIRTMVAGASCMDGVILVVAADDGVMPQTREHLDILTLLGVRHGVVALTKIDRVEPDVLEIVCEDVKDFLKGTFLEGAPILPICNLTGEGFPQFHGALTELVRSIEPKRTDGLFRLPVERAFSVKGYGTVVAGVPVSGSAHTGDEVVLLPHGVKGQIRGIEVYRRPGDTVLAGQCAALNVRQWDHSVIDRGDTVTIPGFFEPQEWYVCSLKLLPLERVMLKSGARVRLHTGTSDVVAAAYLMKGQRVHAGEECPVQFRLADPLVAAPGDRFIVRSLSPVRTIGGGTVIEAVPRRLRRNQPGLLDDLLARAETASDQRAFVEYCIRKADGLTADERTLALRAKVPLARLRGILDELAGEGKVAALTSGLYIHSATAAEACQRLLAVVRNHHDESPQSPGIGPSRLRKAAGLPKVVFDSLIGQLLESGELCRAGDRLALPGHAVSFDEEERECLDAVESLFRAAGFKPPGRSDAAERVGRPGKRVEWALATLLENGQLVEVAEGLLFHRDAVERAKQALVSHISAEGKLESVKFKYLLDTTRKYAIPLLDYFDRVGVTSRVGHTRYLKGAPEARPER